MSQYINEAFKQYHLLEDSQEFALSPEGIDNLGSFMSDAMSDEDIAVEVIDPEADTEDDLKQSYVGKIICDCNVCHSHVFYNKEDIVVDENGVANIDDECPYCMSTDGYTIIGEIQPWSIATEADMQEEEQEEDEPIELSEEEPEVEEVETEEIVEESLTEGIENVVIETEDEAMTMAVKENGGITVDTTPIQEEEVVEEPVPEDIPGYSDEVIAPVEAETEEEILAEEPPVDEIPAEEETTDFSAEEETPEEEEIPEEAADEEDVFVDEFDEDSFNDLGESYLRKNYNNVSSFKTTQVKVQENLLTVDGTITFKSGNQKKTSFVFEALSTTNNKYLFEGYNTQITPNTKSFKLNCSIQGQKLIPESLKYNYSAVNELNESVAIKGSVKTLKRK